MNKISFILLTLFVATVAFFAGRWSISASQHKAQTSIQESFQESAQEKVANQASEGSATTPTAPLSESGLQTQEQKSNKDMVIDVPCPPLEQPENSEKTTQLNRQVRSLTGELERTYRKLDEAYMLMQDAGLQRPDSFDDSVIDDNLPEPFKGDMLSQDFSTKKLFESYVNDERDEAWAQDFENRIYDFYTLHQLGHQIALKAVICKTQYCEIRGFGKEEKANQIIFDDMQKQPWFRGRTFSSSRTAPKHLAELNYVEQFHILVKIRDR